MDESSPFHRHELRNGIRLRVFRKEITVEQRKAVFREIESDLEDNVLAHTPIPWTDTFREAEALFHGDDVGSWEQKLLIGYEFPENNFRSNSFCEPGRKNGSNQF